ncbi:MAG: hypothetical protein GXP22_04320 [Gammaproteobacteria bacterium]|nr:hypothetical protein [Gammaproteobacteria bacterium]
MNQYRWVSIFILILSTNVYSYQSKVEIVEQFDDLKMVAFISKEYINNSPEWIPGKTALPLTVADAIKAVNDFNKDENKVDVISEIEIRKIPKHKKHWHYLIKVANKAMKLKYNIYVVLMSGKVVPAMIQPQSYK